MRTLALLAIRVYQRLISPYKGFCCAYGAHTGRASCSALGYRAVRRFGIWHGVQILDGRFLKCGVAHRRYQGAAPLSEQAGSCDLPCDPSCDLSDCFDIKECWDARKRKRARDEDVHVPPRRRRRPGTPPEGR